MKKEDAKDFFLELFLFSSLILLSVIIVSLVIIYIPDLYIKYPWIEKHTNPKISESAIKICPFVGAFFIYALYFGNEKSIKIFNDLIISLIGTIALYLIFCLGQDQLIKNEYYQDLTSLTIFVSKTLLLMCSFCKVLIYVTEFIDERKNEVIKIREAENCETNALSTTSTIIVLMAALLIYLKEKK